MSSESPEVGEIWRAGHVTYEILCIHDNYRCTTRSPFGWSTPTNLHPLVSGHERWAKRIQKKVIRMWGVLPEVLCDNHLLEEHRSMHKLVRLIKQKLSIGGFIVGFVDTSKIQLRHNLLVPEIKKRGFSHRTPLIFKHKLPAGKINVAYNLLDLSSRCPKCAGRIDRRKLFS